MTDKRLDEIRARASRWPEARTCERCGGVGNRLDHDEVRCPGCRGAGYLLAPQYIGEGAVLARYARADVEYLLDRIGRLSASLRGACGLMTCRTTERRGEDQIPHGHCGDGYCLLCEALTALGDVEPRPEGSDLLPEGVE